MKVLVVDDDTVSRMVLIHMLNSLGIFNVAQAENGEDAWQQLQTAPYPDICLCDVRMPKLSGIELLERVKTFEKLATLPIVIVSSLDDDTVGKSIALGAVGYIAKPFHVADVRMQIEKNIKNVWDRLAENPMTTLRRLNIDTEKLLTYLAAFQNQLTLASPELEVLFQCRKQSDAGKQIERLRSGALMLGLWSVAEAIASLGQGLHAAQEIGKIIRLMIKAVMYQSNLLKGVAIIK